MEFSGNFWVLQLTGAPKAAHATVAHTVATELEFHAVLTRDQHYLAPLG